jgi:hypothetical protein
MEAANARARPTPRERTAIDAPAHSVSRYLRDEGNLMTETDRLIEVAKKLKEARALGEVCSDRALLYFIDMTIVHVCDSLDARPGPRRAAEANLSRARAAL